MEDIAKFIAGFKRFQEHYFTDNKQLYEKLKHRQHPKALVIACGDSRSDPAIITDCDPGDLFVIRNVANLVPPYETDSGFHGVSAALEFAVLHLQVNYIIVLGHSQCGGLKALIETPEGKSFGEFIGHWMEIAKPARDYVQQEFAQKAFAVKSRACEQAALLISLENLLSFPWVKKRVDNGELHLLAWYFDIQKGELLHYDIEQCDFEPLVTGV
jgi:carbonic anhydrase